MRSSSYRHLCRRVATAKRHRRERALAEVCSRQYPSAYYLVDEDSGYYRGGIYVKRFYQSRHRHSYAAELKRTASKRCRRASDVILTGKGYRKTFDLYWELY